MRGVCRRRKGTGGIFRRPVSPLADGNGKQLFRIFDDVIAYNTSPYPIYQSPWKIKIGEGDVHDDVSTSRISFKLKGSSA